MQILTQSHTDQRERRYIKLVTQFGATLTYVLGAKPRDKNPLKKKNKNEYNSNTHSHKGKNNPF